MLHSLSPWTTALQWMYPRALRPAGADRQQVAEIRRLAAELRGLSALALKQRALDLRQTVAGQVRGALPPETTVTGGALVVEAIRRSIGVELYDVQLLAGLALAGGAVAEMQTGEGKTLAAALPAFLWALHGRGVHVMTVNDYLAQRDRQLLAPAFDQLGLSVGLLRRNATGDETRRAYRADITYGPGHQFGFDYLRDQCRLLENRQRLGDNYLRRLQGRQDGAPLDRVQRGQAFALVDEIDSVLLDEATMPLILSDSGQSLGGSASIYTLARQAACQLADRVDYQVDRQHRWIELTEEGRRKCDRWRAPGGVAGGALNRPWWQYVQQAVQAERVFTRDVDYIVRDGRILLVDETTGRVFEDRSWSEGLRQAIETKEQVAVTGETVPVARISRQRYMRLYERLAGMTGTAAGCEHELWYLYRLPVVLIPPRLPSRRTLMPACLTATRIDKWAVVAERVAAIHRRGRPVLVGTRTIEASESLAAEFRRQGIAHQLLNGTQDAPEAEIIARAGRRGAVTIATNMAGRGTDIRLGEGVDALGGLHVVVTEPHDSRRIDRQLIGRGARQGDRGSSQMFIAADDALIARHAPSLGRRIAGAARARDGKAPQLVRAVSLVQRHVERQQYAQRRQLFEQDRWLEEMVQAVGAW